MGPQPVNAVFRVILVIVLTIICSATTIDLIGSGSPWLTLGLATLAAVLVCQRPIPSSICAGTTMLVIDGLVVINGQKDPAHTGLHVAIAALLAAAFALTRSSQTDNSATSQAQEHPVMPVMTSEEVCDED